MSGLPHAAHAAAALGVLAAAAGCGRIEVPSGEPPRVRVDLRRIEALHPAAADLAALRTPAATPAPPGGAPPRPAPPPPPAPAAAWAPVRDPEPQREVDGERAAAEIRADYARRQEAAPLPDSPAPTAQAQPAPEPAPPQPASSFTTGLEPDIARLQRQLDSLRESPADRLVFTPAQLRRRREVFDITQADLERLRREHLSRLRAALAPTGPGAQRERPARLPAAPPRPEPARLPHVAAAEAHALAAIPRGETLPPPVPPAARPSFADPHAAVRDRFAQARPGGGGAPAAGGQTRGDARRRRAEALEQAIREDARAAAVAVAAEAGYRLVTDPTARDATSELLDRLRAHLAGHAKGPRR